MLLPSGLAGMTLDLIENRWGNFAQDILYQEKNPRLASFRYRYLPSQVSQDILANIATQMIQSQFDFYFHMTADQ
jgi:hypothetical protein